MTFEEFAADRLPGVLRFAGVLTADRGLAEGKGAPVCHADPAGEDEVTMRTTLSDAGRAIAGAITVRPRPLLRSNAWYCPTLTEVRDSPASPAGHAVAVVAIASAVYLAQAGQVLAVAAIAVVLAAIVFLKSTPPG
jgi:hypothetical protein